MLDSDKQLLLSGFLGQLPEHVAARLAKAVEVDRLIGGTDLPHDEILRALRPQLRASPERARITTPQRFFCRPLEDFFVGRERTIKQKGRITRTSIEPVWSWLTNELMPERMREISEAIGEAVLENNESEVEKRARELWVEAASVLKEALESEKQQAVAAKKLGGLAAAEDAVEMALLLGGAAEIETLQRRLPKPIVHLSDEDVAFLRDMFDRLSNNNPDLAPYVPLFVMARLERPWEALRLTAVMSRKSTDTMISSTDIGVIGELLFSDLDDHVKKIQSARPVDFDSAAVLASLASFAELSSGMVKELGIRRDGKWGQHLAKDRTAVAQVMETLLERTPKEILAALPAAKVGGFAKGPKPLELSRAPDPERVAKAMRYAHVMVNSRPFAVAAAFSAKLTEAMAETSSMLRGYGEDVLRELRAASPVTRANAEAHFALMLELCVLVLGEEEADLLRRRARVPQSA